MLVLAIAKVVHSYLNLSHMAGILTTVTRLP